MHILYCLNIYSVNINNLIGEWLFEANVDYFNPDNIKHIETKNELSRIERELVRK